MTSTVPRVKSGQSQLGVRPSGGRSWPIEALDAPWTGSTAVSMVGPIEMPSRDDLVQALGVIASCGPDTRVGLLLDEEHSRWVYDAQRLREICEDSVRQTDPPPNTDIGEHLGRVARVASPDANPLRFVISGNYLALGARHALGDGRLMAHLITGVVETARTGLPPKWATDEITAHPLREALRHYFLADRARMRAAVRAVRPRLWDRSAAEATLPWTPSPRAVYRRTSPETFEALRLWRKEHAPGAGSAPVAFAVLHAALRRQGFDPKRNQLVLFDARRYLPPGAEVRGNFAVGLDLSVSPPYAPADYAAALERPGTAGRPLTAMVAGMALRPLLSRMPQTTTAPLRPHPYLAFSHVGRPLNITRMPWTGPVHERVYCGLLEPAGPEGITFAITEVSNGLQVTASFHEGVTDARLIERALDAATADPLSLLRHS